MALLLLSRMKPADRMTVFRELLGMCRSQRVGNIASGHILRLPKEWVLANIDAASRQLLAGADSDDYFSLLRLIKQVDLTLALNLAWEGAENPDEEVRDVCEWFLRNNLR